MENIQSHKSGSNILLQSLAMEGFPLLSYILFELILSVLLWQNAHLQLRYIYLFPPMRPV